jgi:hypothetical protein
MLFGTYVHFNSLNENLVVAVGYLIILTVSISS